MSKTPKDREKRNIYIERERKEREREREREVWRNIDRDKLDWEKRSKTDVGQSSKLAKTWKTREKDIYIYRGER